MKPEQIALLTKAGESLRAARLLVANALPDFAASLITHLAKITRTGKMPIPQNFFSCGMGRRA
ncbi:hypothetical protein QUB70_28430, partial [Microcoleus sp. A003_D6]